MKKIFILTSLLVSFSGLANINSKDNISPENNTNLKSNVKLNSNANLKNNIKAKNTIKSKGNVKNNDSIGYSKVITVHGMVCAFCSNSLEKKLKKEEAIDQVKIELKNKKVSVRFKKGKSVKDKKLKEIITSSGFKVVKIESSTNSG